MYSYTAVKPSFVSLSILPFPDCLIETCFLSCQPLLQREGRCLWRRDKKKRRKDEKRGGKRRKRGRKRSGGRGREREREKKIEWGEEGKGEIKKEDRESRRDKEGERAIGSHAADILVPLSSGPGETTYMNCKTSSDFMVTLESNEHNTLLSWHWT